MMAKKSISTSPAEPVSFVPATDFTEYPFGPAAPVQFRGGIPSPAVPADFLERMRAEGKAAASDADPDAEPAVDPAPDQISDTKDAP